VVLLDLKSSNRSRNVVQGVAPQTRRVCIQGASFSGGVRDDSSPFEAIHTSDFSDINISSLNIYYIGS
jgi:hypothetical protein